MRLRVLLDDPDCMPYKKHKSDAGWDLRSNNEDFVLEKFDRAKIHTGVRLQIPPKHAGIVVPRSGLGTKMRVTLSNDVGVIDSDYRGEVIVNLVNDGNKDLEIKKYDRIAQLLIIPVLIADLEATDRLSRTDRGDNGFGSTGVE